MNAMETKTAVLSLTSVSVDGGSFTGYAAVFGNRDAGNDRIISGAFASSLGEYRKSAHVFWHHDTSKPIARVTDAREDGHGLRIEAAFYSTPTAQESRQVLLERLAAGLDLGMSIGYAILPGGSRIAKDGTRELTRLRLLETSLVPLAMNELAVAFAAKSRSTVDPEQQALRLEKLKFQMHLFEAKYGS